MKICVLKAKDPANSAWSHRIYGAEPFLKEAGYAHVDTIEIVKSTCDEQLEEIVSSKRYDLLFNMCDGAAMDGRAGHGVCEYLNNKCEIPFVGPTVKSYDPTREEMKVTCAIHEIATPKYAFVYDAENDFHRLSHLTFPMIVKHFNSAGSWDLTKECRVANGDELGVQLRRMVERNQGALVEEFIEGREFTCLLADNCDDLDDPIAYDPVEYLFLGEGDTFKYESLKFVT